MAYTTIDNPELYFQTKIYTGNGTNSTAITLDGDENMQPDLVWTKCRSHLVDHGLQDSVRGVGKVIHTNSTTAEGTDNWLLSLDSDGFTLSNSNEVNQSTRTFVAWCWKAGDSNTSVSSSGSGNGAINACTHRANTTAGFSIVKYTGLNSQISDGQHTKVTHGLGVKPDFLIMKNRDSSSDWIVTRGTNNDNHLNLNNTDASSGSLFTGNQNNSDATHFLVGNEGAVNDNGDEFIAYVFAEKKGYSKFGSYTGNGNTDGTFVYTGFRPAYLIIKRSDATNSWPILDAKRDTYNFADNRVWGEASDEEYRNGNGKTDFLSNGFKIRQDTVQFNASGGTYIYMAFAESPFVNSNGVPNNAR